ncbi:membrane protein [Geoalkalibacter ferrihydriticus DSM 17813]|uniref:Membrane protein n=2 Tax=Geoalkalibacter ferrihydriticus TaxID=392333 RepID=A0A0C2HUR0_9BACT|nr:membrane protein [Geoalkalibacter ferrihydriticus DSM 17813]
MMILYYLKLYLLTIPVFFVIDLLWLGVVAKNLYQKNLAHLLSPTVNWPAALLFYFIYIAGIILFAVRPALAGQSLSQAALWGALFGFFTYATYDLTNLATLRDWPINVVIIDIAWGTLLCTLVASVSYLIGRWLI